jgi:hypothetical protein
MIGPFVHSLMLYARGCGLKGLDTLPEDALLGYLAFHMEHGSLAAVSDRQGCLSGLGIGWQFHLKAGELPAAEDPRTVTDPGGNAFYCAHLAGETGHDVRQLLRIFNARIPRWRDLVLVARRRGQLVLFSARYVDRLVRAAVGHPQAS